jgi:cell wall-associated NlpC family hydrolase
MVSRDDKAGRATRRLARVAAAAVLVLAAVLAVPSPPAPAAGASAALGAWSMPSALGARLRFSPSEAWRGQILQVAERYGGKSFIPYVWGGDAVAEADVCLECRSCVMGKRRLSVYKRKAACPACRACGMDCSHFVNRIYREAGLPFPYASTRALTRSSAADLRKTYGLVDLGRDVRTAQPGDLLLHRDHVMLLLRLTADHRGDVLHVSRSITRKGVPGGVEVVRDADLRTFRGPVKRVLRHEMLLDGVSLAPAWELKRTAGS